jgi:hypothetical protein
MSSRSNSDSDSDTDIEYDKETEKQDELHRFIMCEDYITIQYKNFLLDKINDEHQDKIYSYQVPTGLMLKTDILFKMYKRVTLDTTLTNFQYRDNLIISAMNLIRFESRNAIKYNIVRYEDDVVSSNGYKYIDYISILHS